MEEMCTPVLLEDPMDRKSDGLHSVGSRGVRHDSAHSQMGDNSVRPGLAGCCEVDGSKGVGGRQGHPRKDLSAEE